MHNNAKKIWNENKKLIIIAGAAILIVALYGMLYSAGYRFRSNFTIGKLGYLNMTVPLPETSIFIDQATKIVTTKENEEIKIAFSPDLHSVIISHDGYFPWKKDFLVPSSGNVTLSPLFVASNPSGVIIPKADKEYSKLRNNIIRDSLPTRANPRTSKDTSTILWVEDNAIIAKKGEKIQTVIQPDTLVKNVDFYKNRSDAVIFSTATGVYALEIDVEGNQNFLPLYSGKAPSFITGESNYIYVLDGENLMQIVI